MARYMVAAVVTVFVVVVVVMVITVTLRPVDLSLSISQGHIGASPLWNSQGAGGNGGGRTSHLPRLRPRQQPRLRPRPQFAVASAYIQGAVKSVDIDIRLRAYNPSGRADIRCNNITGYVLDMPNYPFFTGMVEIKEFQLKEPFTLRRQTYHMLRRSFTIKDASVLSYVATNYGGFLSFAAMVKVSANISSDTVVKKNRVVTHYCWPVTVGYYEPSASADTVTCKRSEQMNYPINFTGPPAPAPAPAPASAPAPTAGAG